MAGPAAAVVPGPVPVSVSVSVLFAVLVHLRPLLPPLSC